jgi:hypothetical protein
MSSVLATVVRQYLTTWLWYRDRLCCLPSVWLVGFAFICTAVLAALAPGLHQFLDDLAILLAENDLRAALVVLGLVLLVSGSTWLLACCLAALAWRLVLQFRGL